MDLSLLSVFVLTFGAILILPGPNAAFAVAQSLKYGSIAALPVPLGYVCATCVMAILVFSGLGLVIQQFAIVLVVLKWAGVVYLIYLAYKSFSAKKAELEIKAQNISKVKMFASAMVVSLTNPKAWLASIMVYPLAISPEHSYFIQAAIITLCAMVISFSVYGSYCVLASRLSKGFGQSIWAKKIVGGLYLGAAGGLALK